MVRPEKMADLVVFQLRELLDFLGFDDFLKNRLIVSEFGNTIFPTVCEWRELNL